MQKVVSWGLAGFGVVLKGLVFLFGWSQKVWDLFPTNDKHLGVRTIGAYTNSLFASLNLTNKTTPLLQSYTIRFYSLPE